MAFSHPADSTPAAATRVPDGAAGPVMVPTAVVLVRRLSAVPSAA
ncbi:hypothetical protein ACFWBF_01510 [Streptomyces sp. NPDC060028]